MKEYMAKKSVGFYISLIAAILSLVGIFLFGGVTYKNSIVYVFLIAAVVLEVLMIVLSGMKGNMPIFNCLPIVNAVLMASAAVWGVSLMVNQIGYVIAGLDEMSTIMGLIYFEVAAAAGMLLNIVASFLSQGKKES